MKNSSSFQNFTLIAPSKGWIPVSLSRLWEYRELLYFLIWKDLKVRYKQTLLGIAWVILQPFLTMVVFSLFFGSFAKVPSDGFPYPVFTFTALLPWQLFANSVSFGGNSLINNQNLITKIYFPRIIIPISTVFTGLVDFAVAFLVLMLIMFYYNIAITFTVLLIPLFLVLAVITALSVSLLISALNVRYRDLRYAIPFIIQFWLFATPIAYPLSIVPQEWRFIYSLNPMVGVVEGFRWCLLKSANPPDITILVSVLISLFLLIVSLFYFNRLERTFADEV